MYLQRYFPDDVALTQEECPAELHCHHTNSEHGDCIKGTIGSVDKFICIQSRMGDVRLADGVSMSQELAGCIYLERVNKETGTGATMVVTRSEVCSYEAPTGFIGFDDCVILNTTIADDDTKT
jgi:hypothetical protein